MNARSLRPLLPLALAAALACQSGSSQPTSQETGKKAEITNEYTATAHVVAVAAASRTVTLRREDGAQFDVHAGESVRNFDQIAVGDVLRVRYKETLAAEKLPAGEATKPAVAAMAAGRAPVGAQPAAGVGVGVSVRVKIESIDLEKGIVTFSLASGELISRRIQTPQGREFVKSLAVGDVVQLSYAESLALSVEKL